MKALGILGKGEFEQGGGRHWQLMSCDMPLLGRLLNKIRFFRRQRSSATNRQQEEQACSQVRTAPRPRNGKLKTYEPMNP